VNFFYYTTSLASLFVEAQQEFFWGYFRITVVIQGDILTDIRLLFCNTKNLIFVKITVFDIWLEIFPAGKRGSRNSFACNSRWFGENQDQGRKGD